LLGCTNVVGDFSSSLTVGALIAVSPVAAFLYAAGCMLLGAVAMARTREPGA
jgi:hypothetical protein